MKDTKEELRALFVENLELGKWANAQALITEISNSDVLEATKWSGELTGAQDAIYEELKNDEQMRHAEEKTGTEY